VNGGNEIAGTYARYEKLGNGFVFGFADRLDHNYMTTNPTAVNKDFFLAISTEPIAATSIPEPTTLITNRRSRDSLDRILPPQTSAVTFFRLSASLVQWPKSRHLEVAL